MLLPLYLVTTLLICAAAAEVIITVPAANRSWVAESQNPLVWTCKDMPHDAFTVYIVNNDVPLPPLVCREDMARLLQMQKRRNSRPFWHQRCEVIAVHRGVNSDCFRTIAPWQLKGVLPGVGYRLEFHNSTGQVFAISDEFEVKPNESSLPSTNTISCGNESSGKSSIAVLRSTGSTMSLASPTSAVTALHTDGGRGSVSAPLKTGSHHEMDVVANPNRFKITAPGPDWWWVAESPNRLAWTVPHDSAAIYIDRNDCDRRRCMIWPRKFIAVLHFCDRATTISWRHVALPPARGYVIQFANAFNISDVFAISEEFEIKPRGSAHPGTHTNAVTDPSFRILSSFYDVNAIMDVAKGAIRTVVEFLGFRI